MALRTDEPYRYHGWGNKTSTWRDFTASLRLGILEKVCILGRSGLNSGVENA